MGKDENFNKLINKSNAIVNRINSIIHTQTPLPAQVEAAEIIHQIIHDEGKTIRFNLPTNQIAKSTTKGWGKKATRRRHVELNRMATSLLKNENKIKQQTKRWTKRKEQLRELRNKVLNGSIPSMVVDTACTSTVVRPEEAKHVQILQEKSTKIFHNANGTISKAENKALLHLPLREPANNAEIVPGLALNTLLSGPKLADANYIAIFTPEEVQIFDAETTRINVQGEAILRGAAPKPNCGTYRSNSNGQISTMTQLF